MANSRNSRYFASISDARPPYFRKNFDVSDGKTAKARTQTPIKIRVLMVKGEKISPSAITVPRSLMKQAARIDLPKSVLLNPSSSMTAYTTATEVVLRATPASQLGRVAQWST